LATAKTEDQIALWEAQLEKIEGILFDGEEIAKEEEARLAAEKADKDAVAAEERAAVAAAEKLARS
jgi:hypothetical protein